MPPGTSSVTPTWPASSVASARVIPTTPNFEAQYAVASGSARRPSVEATVTILPRLSFSAGSAARMTAAVPNRLTATTCSHSAAGTSPSAPQRSVPAAVTTASTPPARSISARIASSAAAVSARSTTALSATRRGAAASSAGSTGTRSTSRARPPAVVTAAATARPRPDAAPVTSTVPTPRGVRPAGAGSTTLRPSESVMSEAAVSGRVWVTGFLPSG